LIPADAKDQRAKAWFVRGCSAQSMSNTTEAIKSYQEALELKPDHKDAQKRMQKLVAKADTSSDRAIAQRLSAGFASGALYENKVQSAMSGNGAMDVDAFGLPGMDDDVFEHIKPVHADFYNGTYFAREGSLMVMTLVRACVCVCVCVSLYASNTFSLTVSCLCLCLRVCVFVCLCARL
jgi:tetratricopeptide (TPR) repeat protein